MKPTEWEDISKPTNEIQIRPTLEVYKCTGQSLRRQDVRSVGKKNATPNHLLPHDSL
jgi:hypothetical protein